MYRLMQLPLLVVISSIAFNVMYFWVALQQGRFSYNSVMWIFYQSLTVPAAAKGDLIPWLNVRMMLSQATS